MLGATLIKQVTVLKIKENMRKKTTHTHKLEVSFKNKTGLTWTDNLHINVTVAIKYKSWAFLSVTVTGFVERHIQLLQIYRCR